MLCSLDCIFFLVLLHVNFLFAAATNQTWQLLIVTYLLQASFAFFLHLQKFTFSQAPKDSLRWKTCLPQDRMIYWNWCFSALTWHRSTVLFLWSLRKRLVRHVCIQWKEWLISGSGFQGVFCRVFICIFSQSYGPLLGSAKGCVSHCLPALADYVNRNKNQFLYRIERNRNILIENPATWAFR